MTALAIAWRAAAFLRANPVVMYLAAGLALAAFLYLWGASDAADRAERKLLEGAVKAARVRLEAAADARDSSEFDLCLALGGLRDECEPLRRAEPPAPAE